MNIPYTITLEGFTFDCIVTDYWHQPALGKWCDSDIDCYGYTDIESFIEAPMARSGLDFLAYLHELGHCKSKQPDFYFALNGNKVVWCNVMKSSRWAFNDARITCEYNAWEWALKYYRRLGFTLTNKHKEMIAGYFGNYLFSAENRETAVKYAHKINSKFSIGVRHDFYYEGY